MVAVADTYALIWYVAANPSLTPTARKAIDDAAAVGNEVAISSSSLVEIVYLTEKGRIDPATFNSIRGLLGQQGVLVEAPVDQEIALSMRSIDRAQVPDMPDRIIAATALKFGAPLISRD